MADLDWKWIIIIGAIIYLLSTLTPKPITVGTQAILNVEQEKTATILIGLTAPTPDTDTSDGNYTVNTGAYRIITTNGSIIKDWTETVISTNYQTSIEYAPLYNSTIQAKVEETLYSYNTTTNVSAQVSKKTIITQDININVVGQQAAPVVVTTSSGGWTPVSTGTPIKVSTAITPETVVVEEESFGEKYGLLILLVISFVIFGLVVFSYLSRKGKRKR